MPKDPPQNMTCRIAGAPYGCEVRVGILLWLCSSLVLCMASCGWLRSNAGETQSDEVSESFVRCNSSGPPAAQNGTSGQTRYEIRDRSLTLTPTGGPVRMAVLAAAGFGTGASELALDELRDSRVDLLVVLGGLGRSADHARASVQALRSLRLLTLVVPSGVDGIKPDPFGAAPGGSSDAPPLLSAAGLRTIRVGEDTLFLWAGSEAGRYSSATDGCGFTAAELEALAERTIQPRAGERRWLLSWQAPTASPALAQFVERTHIRGALSAWPAAGETEPRPWGQQAVRIVARAWGPRSERPDGTLVPAGVTVLRFVPSGPEIER